MDEDDRALLASGPVQRVVAVSGLLRWVWMVTAVATVGLVAVRSPRPVATAAGAMVAGVIYAGLMALLLPRTARRAYGGDGPRIVPIDAAALPASVSALRVILLALLGALVFLVVAVALGAASGGDPSSGSLSGFALALPATAGQQLRRFRRLEREHGGQLWSLSGATWTNRQARKRPLYLVRTATGSAR